MNVSRASAIVCIPIGFKCGLQQGARNLALMSKLIPYCFFSIRKSIPLSIHLLNSLIACARHSSGVGFMSSRRMAKEFTKKGKARQHRCEKVFRVLSKEAGKLKEAHDGEWAEGNLRRIRAGHLVGRYCTDSEDVLDPWLGCIVTLEEASGPRFKGWTCPACLSNFSLADVESGRKVELVDDRWVIVESEG